MTSYTISVDPSLIQLDHVHALLAASYWSPNVRKDLVARAISHSFVVGAYLPDGLQVGFARAVSDRASFAWLCDVIVDPAHQHHGLGKRMVAALLAHPELQNLRRWCLATRDAHSLYAQFGFEPVPADRWMELRFPPQTWQSLPDQAGPSATAP